jgi:hypothetical protein
MLYFKRTLGALGSISGRLRLPRTVWMICG